MVEAVAYCRSGKGPALVHGHVVRPYSHSLSDDERAVSQSEEELAGRCAARSDLEDGRRWLLREGVLDEAALNEPRTQAVDDREYSEATDRALASRAATRWTSITRSMSTPRT